MRSVAQFARVSPAPLVSLFRWSVAVAALAIPWQYAHGQFAEEADEAPMQTRIFSVADLVLPAPDYSFEGIDLSVGLGSGSSFGPKNGSSNRGMPGGAGFGGGGFGGGGFGGGGFGGGGFGGGGGGGFFQIGGGGLGGGGFGGGAAQDQPERASTTRRFGMEDLVQVILSTVEPESWDVVGGEGNISTLGTMLVVRQAPAVLEQIGELLMAIRQTGGTLQSVTVRADWLLLDPGQLAELYTNDADAATIDRQALQKLSTSNGASGRITCLDGQTVHLVAGKVQSGVSSVVPVVGQDSSPGKSPTLPRLVLAQQLQPAAEDATESRATTMRQRGVGAGGISGDGLAGATRSVPSSKAVGYQPVMQARNLGALLQVTPTVVQGWQGVVLDLRSLAVRQGSQVDQPVEFHDIVPLDRVNVVVQQFMTTLHLPLGEPRLIAGSSLQPFAQEENPKQLYLVVEVTLEGPK